MLSFQSAARLWSVIPFMSNKLMHSTWSVPHTTLIQMPSGLYRIFILWTCSLAPRRLRHCRMESFQIQWRLFISHENGKHYTEMLFHSNVIERAESVFSFLCLPRLKDIFRSWLEPSSKLSIISYWKALRRSDIIIYAELHCTQI